MGIFIGISLAAFCMTLLGGFFALRFRDRLHLILGFSAGAIVGVAFFDLIPEAIALTAGVYDVSLVTSVFALGFGAYMILDRLIVFHADTDDGGRNENRSAHKGMLGAGSLAVHSFLDGLAIGLSFHVSNAVGVIVAAAVLTHDFSDGINTVGMILKNNGQRRHALQWLLVDALAPVLGVASTFFFTLPAHMLGLSLAVFSGFFLYIGASDLLPESHHSHPTILTTVMTILGMGVLYVIIRLVGT